MAVPGEACAENVLLSPFYRCPGVARERDERRKNDRTHTPLRSEAVNPLVDPFNTAMYGGPYWIGPTAHTNTYIFSYFYEQSLVLFTMVPRNRLNLEVIGSNSKRFVLTTELRVLEGSRGSRQVQATNCRVALIPVSRLQLRYLAAQLRKNRPSRSPKSTPCMK